MPAGGLCETPWSFDIGSDGSIWVIDTANQRLVGWEPDHPGKPTRTIPLSFGAADLAIGPDGTIYVSGSKPGVGMRLFAFTPDGTHLWTGPLLSQMFNQHIRFGGDGILYGVEGRTGWAPAVGADGRPLSLAEQRLGARAYQPVSANSQLVVSAPWRVPPHHVAPTDWRVAIASATGHLQQVWHIVSADDVNPSFEATSAVVDGAPVIVFEVYEFAKHLMEYDVVQLSRSEGDVLRFSLGRGSDGAATTDVRVGPDHAIYQLQNDPEHGLKIARYPLLRAQTPTPTASGTPTVTPSTPPTTTPSSRTTRPVVGLAIAAAVVLVVALGGALWMRRRSRGERAGG